MINFNATKKDMQIIDKIVKRVCADAILYSPNMDILGLEMDITAAHLNGAPLKLQDLLDADDFNFRHDVSGIFFNINRKTGKLENCFSPRFSMPDKITHHARKEEGLHYSQIPEGRRCSTHNLDHA
jgi:hypothetical protein